MYPTFTAVLQVTPGDSSEWDPETFRVAVREVVEAWFRSEARGAYPRTESTRPASGLRVVAISESPEANGEIREAHPDAVGPWAWEGTITRPCPCDTFPDIPRTLESRVQLRTAEVSDSDSRDIAAIGYKVIATIYEGFDFGADYRSPGPLAEYAPVCGLLHKLLAVFNVYQGHHLWKSEEFWSIDTQRDAVDLTQVVFDSKRRVPLVVCTGLDRDGLAFDPGLLSLGLFGTARVAVIRKSGLCNTFSNHMPYEHRVFPGVVRLFRAGYRQSDPPGVHPFVRRSEIDSKHATNFVEHLVWRIQRGESSLFRGDQQVAESLSKAEKLQSNLHAQSVRATLELLEKQSELGQVNPTELREAVELINEERSKAQTDRDAALADARWWKDEVDRLEGESYRLDEQVASLQKQTRAMVPQSLLPIEQQPSPSTLTEAVRQVMDYVLEGEIVVLPVVSKHLDKIRGINPGELRFKLNLVREVANACRSGHGNGKGPAEHFAEMQIEYKSDISDTAKQQFRKDYEVRYDDGSGERKVLLGPHVDLSERHRIYWYHDKSNRRFVIGHIGDHLKDASTR